MDSTDVIQGQSFMPDSLEEVLSWFGISKKKDPMETRCVCAALEVCLQDLGSDTPYSRTRRILGPLAPEIRAHIPEAISVRHSGQVRDKSPWVNLAVEISNFGFIRSPEKDDAALKTIWRLLVELLCANPPMRATSTVIQIVNSLRTRVTELSHDPSAVKEISFSDPVSLVRDFEKNPGPFPASIVKAWRTLKPSLLGLLLYPDPEWLWSNGELTEEDLPTQVGGDDAASESLAGFYIPSDEGLFGPTLTTAGRQLVMETHLSTVTSLSRLTLGSSTHLSDEELSNEAAYLVERAVSCHDAGDLLQAQAMAGRLVVLATASNAECIGRLRWGEADDARYGVTYPGRLSPDARWLFRPQLDPNERDGKARSTALDPVWVPIPETLCDVILRVGSTPGPGNLVFPDLRRSASLVDTARRSYPTASLRRALIERLARSEPLGLSAAQYVSCDSLGISLAPLHYERYSADQFASSVEAITFPWFGDRVGRPRSVRARHHLGAGKLVPHTELKTFLEGLRADEEALQQLSLVERLRIATRNTVHGLALVTGHRPNDAFGTLTINDLSFAYPVGIVRDKQVSPDWLARPVALPGLWRQQFFSLLSLLGEAKQAHPDTALAGAADAALSGTGTVFLRIDSSDHVAPFDLASYQDGLPETLKAMGNFARHHLNVQLLGSVEESLRVGQLGWHGTREGAWSDISPWSVLSAAERLEPVLERVLRRAGWKPVTRKVARPEAAPVRLGWRDWELQRTAKFKRAIAKAKGTQAKRHAAMAVPMVERLRDWLALEGRSKLRLMEGSSPCRLVRSTETKEPVPLSRSDSERMIGILAGAGASSVEVAVARNLLSTALRRARREGHVLGPVPGRVVWTWPQREGWFAPGMARALAERDILDAWLVAGANQLPFALQVALGLLLHGPYGCAEKVLAVMQPGVRLHHLEAHPGVLVAGPPRLGSEDSDYMPFAAFWERHGCLAFHGLAALCLKRWHAEKPTVGMTRDAIDALWAQHRPASWTIDQEHDVLEELAALARTCHALTMDGPARLVGTGTATPRSAPMERVVALLDCQPLEAVNDWTSHDVPAQAAFHENESGARRGPTLGRLMNLFTGSVGSVSGGTLSESIVRERLKKGLRRWVTKISGPVRPEDLVARYALALLESGGLRRRRLELETIRGYLYEVASHVVKALPRRPLERPDDWEKSYVAAVASVSPPRRPVLARALLRFHAVLSREILLPAIDTAAIARLVDDGGSLAHPQFLTGAEVQAIACALQWDLCELDLHQSSGELTHVALASRAVFMVNLGAALRTGEGARLKRSDVKSRCVRIRKSSLQRLKSVNARRLAPLDGVSLKPEEALRPFLEPPGGQGTGDDGPLYPAMKNGDEPLPQPDLYGRIGTLVRWFSGQTDATVYCLRKTAVWRRFSAYQARSQASLWGLRDLLAGIGHSSIEVTLNWYTHDPVTPLRRWFDHAQQPADVAHLMAASGLSKSTIARKHGDKRLGRTVQQGTMRVAHLLGASTAPSSLGGGAIRMPPSLHQSDRHRLAADELFEILYQLASTHEPIDEVLLTWRWPASLATMLLQCLDELADEYDIRIGSANATQLVRTPTATVVSAPRRHEDLPSIRGLLSEPASLGVLVEMSDDWLKVRRYASVKGIPASPSRWAHWCEKAPALSELAWSPVDPSERHPTYRLQASAKHAKSGQPVLEFALLTAWIHRSLSHRLGRESTIERDGVL